MGRLYIQKLINQSLAPNTTLIIINLITIRREDTWPENLYIGYAVKPVILNINVA